MQASEGRGREGKGQNDKGSCIEMAGDRKEVMRATETQTVTGRWSQRLSVTPETERWGRRCRQQPGDSGFQGKKVIRGAEQKTAPEAWSTPRAGAEAWGTGRGEQWGSRVARDSPGRVSPDPSGRARIPSASWPRCRGISQGGTQGPRPVPASPPQTQRIGLLGPLGSLGLSRQAKIFSLTTQGWTGLLGK